MSSFLIYHMIVFLPLRNVLSFGRRGRSRSHCACWVRMCCLKWRWQWPWQTLETKASIDVISRFTCWSWGTSRNSKVIVEVSSLDVTELAIDDRLDDKSGILEELVAESVVMFVRGFFLIDPFFFCWFNPSKPLQ